MIKIGVFARLAGVSIATLRLYDDKGLLHPEHVDDASHYRYYAFSQLPRLNRILSLKDLGFTLEQIREALQDEITPAQLRGMLKLRRAEAQQRLDEEQQRLERLEVRLRWIEQEDQMSPYEVVLKTVPATLVAARRITIPSNDQVPQYLNPAFGEVYDHIGTHSAKVAAPHLAVWHTTASTLEEEDAEAVVPIESRVPSSERVQVYELPQVEVASVVFQGDYSAFPQVHAALLRWIEEHGYVVSGAFREVYCATTRSTPRSKPPRFSTPSRSPEDGRRDLLGPVLWFPARSAPPTRRVVHALKEVNATEVQSRPLLGDTEQRAGSLRRTHRHGYGVPCARHVSARTDPAPPGLPARLEDERRDGAGRVGLAAASSRATFVALDRAGHDWSLPGCAPQRLFAALVHDGSTG